MDPVLDEFLQAHVPILRRDLEIQTAHLYDVYMGFHHYRERGEKTDPVPFEEFWLKLARALREQPEATTAK